MKVKVKDPIIKRVVKKFIGRSNVGFKKYGKTLMDDPTDMDGWLNHLQEELMDAVNYIERAREELSRKELEPKFEEDPILEWWYDSPSVAYRTLPAPDEYKEPTSGNKPFYGYNVICNCGSGKCSDDA